MMVDRQHDDVGRKVAAIVDDAIAELLLLGMESADHAAELMASLAVVRIKDQRMIEHVAEFALSFVERGGEEC